MPIRQFTQRPQHVRSVAIARSNAPDAMQGDRRGTAVQLHIAEDLLCIIAKGMGDATGGPGDGRKIGEESIGAIAVACLTPGAQRRMPVEQAFVD